MPSCLISDIEMMQCAVSNSICFYCDLSSLTGHIYTCTANQFMAGARLDDFSCSQ